MFKAPRKTIHTDARCSYETVHDSVTRRLTDPEEMSAYLCDIAPLAREVDGLTPLAARARYIELASQWMLPDELASFADVVVATESRPHNWCHMCEKVTDFAIDDTQDTQTCLACACEQPYVGAIIDRHIEYGMERPTMSSPYRRSNHFSEWLNSFMARQNGNIPNEVYDKIRGEMKKQRLTDVSTLTLARLRAMMKVLRLSKYYEYGTLILCQIKGEQPPTIDPELEEELRVAFNAIQTVFDDVVKEVLPERRNFMSYSYTIHKLLQLMEQDELAEQFPLLRAASKTRVQDQLWKAVCDRLGWTFIPSV